MCSLRSAAAATAHEAWFPGFRAMLSDMGMNDRVSGEELHAQQCRRLVSMIRFAVRNVPYYRVSVAKFGVAPDSIRTPADLMQLPILRREHLQRSPADFLPDNRRNPADRVARTSGTTGTPLDYHLSRSDRAVGLALMYRGWGYAGYCLGDSVAVLAGRSLGAAGRSFTGRLADLSRNMARMSAFDMTDEALVQYIASINRARPAFIRGYASALQVLARRIHRMRSSVWQPRAVFTTAETLQPDMRVEISGAFHCPVFDGYGLNDGGVSAYECEAHSGLHIDTERSILEVVDEHGVSMTEGVGRIIATTLTNYAMPLLRYDTGDIGEVARSRCQCGLARPLLKAIHGRSTDILVTPEGKLVHGWFFVYLLRGMSRYVREFRVIQETTNDLTLILVPGPEFDGDVLSDVRAVINELSPAWIVRIETVNALPCTGGDKMKYIENRLTPLDELT